MTEVEYRDINGREIGIGDFVIYAAAWGRSSVLKYGLVVELKTRPGAYVQGMRKEFPTLRVITAEKSYWRDGWRLQKEGKTVTISRFEAMIVVAKEDVNEQAHEILTAAALKSHPELFR